MATEKHIINKVSVQLKGLPTQSAFQLQQDLSQYLRHSLPAKLDRWLDAHFPKDQWIEIDTLQINIESEGVFSQKKLEVFIEEELQKQLVKRAQSLPASTNSSEPISPFRAWLYFMENGRLPWWYTGHIIELEDKVKDEWKARPTQSESLLQAAIGKEVVRQRLVMQSSLRLFEALLTVLRITTYEWEQWRDEIVKAVDNKPGSFRWQTDAQYRNNLSLAIRYVFLQQVLARPHRDLRADERTVLHIVSALEKSGRQTEVMLRKLDDGLSTERPVTAEKNALVEKDEKEQHIIIDNAGLVLFHPYLEFFFRAMGLLNETGFELLYPGKAIQLLHYLSTGKTVCAENETVLNKIICGIGEEETVYTQYPVSPEEEAECRSLLEAVIRNWPALKSTSPEGLQETFVQRTGKLSWKVDHWLLQVEQKTVDVLLNKLQWPLSVIRLPWMQSWLQVEWT